MHLRYKDKVVRRKKGLVNMGFKPYLIGKEPKIGEENTSQRIPLVIK